MHMYMYIVNIIYIYIISNEQPPTPTCSGTKDHRRL